MAALGSALVTAMKVCKDSRCSAESRAGSGSASAMMGGSSKVIRALTPVQAPYHNGPSASLEGREWSCKEERETVAVTQ
jgi:hypothetical protein